MRGNFQGTSLLQPPLPGVLSFCLLSAGLILILEQLRRQGQPTRPVPLSAWTPEFWQQLRDGDSLRQFLRSSRAPSTLSTYASQQRQFQLFCALLGVSSPQSCFHPDVLAAWVMGRSTHAYKLSTIELGVYAVCDLASQHSIRLSASMPVLKTALQAAARVRGSGPSRKQPLLRPLLLQLCSSDSHDWLAARDHAFYALSWHGMFRSSEVVALTWSDITWQPQGFIVLVRASKTDQSGQGQFVFIHAQSPAYVDPCRTLGHLAQLSPSLSGHIFTTHQYQLQPVSKNTMLTRLHRRLQHLALPSHLFGLHSLRSGGATAAAQMEVPERLIKVHGRWVSDTVRLYTCAVPMDRWATSIAMGGQS